MKIVILDGYTENPGDLSWEPLEKLGQVTVYDRISYEESPEIAEKIGDAEIVVTNKTPVSRETMDRCPGIRLIAVMATGYNIVDYTYAREKGIPVVNVPSYGTQIVGQYAVSLLLEICSHIGYHSETVKSGKWEKNPDWCYWDHPMIELYGKTAGIVGLGRIGQATAKILNALNMKVIAYDAHQSPQGAELAEYVDLDTLWARSDVIFLHCPLFPETQGIINRDTIEKMKDGVILVNAARGGIFDEKSLADFLAAGKIGAVGIDVHESEPCTDSPLREFDNAILTPHIAASTQEAQLRAGVQTAEYVAAGLEGSIVPTALNMAPVPPEVMDAVGPYVPACQMMGSMLAQIDGEIPQFLKLTTAGALAHADASILVAGTLKGILSYQSTATVTPVNADAVAKRHGIKVETLS